MTQKPGTDGGELTSHELIPVLRGCKTGPGDTGTDRCLMDTVDKIILPILVIQGRGSC